MHTQINNFKESPYYKIPTWKIWINHWIYNHIIGTTTVTPIINHLSLQIIRCHIYFQLNLFKNFCNQFWTIAWVFGYAMNIIRFIATISNPIVSNHLCSITKFVKEDIWRLVFDKSFYKPSNLAKTLINSDLIQRFQELEFLKMKYLWWILSFLWSAIHNCSSIHSRW